MPIAKVVKKVSLTEQPKDFAYWQTRPYQERLEALEQIRREYHRWAYGGEPSFNEFTESSNNHTSPQSKTDDPTTTHRPLHPGP